jgi:tRNA pseudouridine38-40 synthase
MPNIRLLLEYDGSRFYGWQIQPNKKTVQGEITRVLELVLKESNIKLEASGRTDSGVHARGQVANFHVKSMPNLKQLAHSINSILREEVSVLNIDIVPDDFHSRFSSKSKTYVYTIFNRNSPPIIDRKQVWFVPQQLNIELMQECANLLIGSKDFSSFRSKDCTATNTIKEIYQAKFIRNDPYLKFSLEGNGFLKNMVRIIVGTLVDVGKGLVTTEQFNEILKAKNRSKASQTAPAEGLCLEFVKY